MEKIEISHRTIIFTAFFLAGLWVVYQLRSVLLLFFIAFILMTALNPLVEKLQKLKVNRVLSIILVYFLLLGLFSFAIASIIPPMIEQTSNLASNFSLPIGSDFFKTDFGSINDQIEALSRNAISVLKIVSSAASNILGIFTVLVLTFYLLLERKNFPKYYQTLFGDGEKRKRIERLVEGVEYNLGGWVRGQIILMFIVGLMSYIGLRILGIRAALTLALIAGLLEFIPNLGPTLAAVPAVIIGLTMSTPMALGVAFLYIIIQQLENNIIVPQVMRKAVGLNPLITLMALMAGFSLGGIGGAVLAVPMFLVARVIVFDLYTKR